MYNLEIKESVGYRRKKVLVVAPTPFFADRGTHIRILEEALALEKLGYDIIIATYHIGNDIHKDVKTDIDVRRIRRLLFWYKKLEAGPDWQKILLDIMLIRKVFNLARTQNPDIIHAHLHEGVLIGWIVKKLLFRRKIKLVADFHGSLTREMVSHDYLKNGIVTKLFKKIEKFINNLGDYAITSSWENTEEISKAGGGKNVETVADGVSLEHYAGVLSKEKSRIDMELPADKVIAVYTGALVANKGTQYLLEAIPLVLKKTDSIYFVIAGFPAEGVREFVKKNNLEDKVRVVSPLSYFKLPEILSAADVGIDPKDSSTHQASGKILQYMAAGLPVVCFDRENNRKYLEEGACYSKDISAQGLADCILSFVIHPYSMEHMSESNKRKIIEFSWSNSAKKIDRIYRSLLNKK